MQQEQKDTPGQKIHHHHTQHLSTQPNNRESDQLVSTNPVLCVLALVQLAVVRASRGVAARVAPVLQLCGTGPYSVGTPLVLRESMSIKSVVNR